MKYIAVIDTDDYEDFEFFEDGNGKYLHGIDAGSVNGEWICLYCKQAPDVVEREKIDKAIEEMDKLASHKVRPISFDQAVAIDMCIEILKRNIGE